MLYFIIFLCIIGMTRGQDEIENRISLGKTGKLEEVFRWKQIFYSGLRDKTSSDAIFFPSNEVNDTGGMILDHTPYNNVPMGVEHFKGRLFITVPRRRPGVPSTLNYIEIAGRTNNLRPFPNIMTNSLHADLHADSNKIISVYRTRLDACSRLWFIDTGWLEYPDNQTQVQPPSIWVTDPSNGNTLRRFEFPANVEQRGNGVASITVDCTENNCDDAFAYVPDLFFNRMYVYSYRQNRMWSFVHNFFRMHPFQGDLNVAGLRYQWDDGIFSITLGPRKNNGYRDVYFHPMISIDEFVVSSEVLQNEQNADRVWHGDDFRLLGSRGEGTQSAMHQLDLRTGVIFYSEIGRNAIGCINSAKSFNSQNYQMLVQDNDRMIYPSDLKVDSDGILWVFTNSLPIFIYSNLNTMEYNFRVWKANASEIIKGTVCDVDRSGLNLDSGRSIRRIPVRPLRPLRYK